MTGEKLAQVERSLKAVLGLPAYVIDAPGGGKIPLLPDYLQQLGEDEVLLKNYRGELYSYCNVPPAVPAEERRQAVNSGGQG